MSYETFRIWIAVPAFLVLGVLQSWDSGVLGSTPAAIAVVALGIVAPAAAFALTARAAVQLAALALSMILMVTARMISPVPLPELALVSFTGFLLFFAGHKLREREEVGAAS